MQLFKVSAFTFAIISSLNSFGLASLPSAESTFSVEAKTDPSKPTYKEGTAFAITPNIVLTNHHVVEKSEGLPIHLVQSTNGIEHRVALKKEFCSPYHDICAFSADATLVPFTLSNAEVTKGQDAFLFGNLLGNGLAFRTGTAEQSPSPNIIFYTIENGVGDSGAPILNSNGEVVGVNYRAGLAVSVHAILELLKSKSPKIYEQVKISD